MWSFLRDHNYKATKHVTTNMILAAMTMMTSVFAYGFENSVLGAVQAMDAYEEVFGQVDGKGGYMFTADRLAFLNSFPLITYGLGVIAASFVGEHFGRKVTFYGMNSICLIGVGICYGGRTYALALVGRMIVNIHVGAEAWLIVMWLAEIVPAAVRGSMTGLYAFSHIFAGFIASVIVNSTSKIEGNDSWKIPIACMFAFPVLCLLLGFLLPESPRWLVRKGRFQEAIDNIYYLNSADRDYPAETEVEIIKDLLENAPVQLGWKELFKGINARRTWIGILTSAASQATGQSFASTYGTIFLKRIAVIDPFTGTMIKRAGLLVGCLFVILTVEHIGRRRMALVVGSLCATCLMVMGGLGTVQPETKGTNNGILAMSIIFPCMYMIGFGSTMQVIKSEVPHTTLREKSNMVFWSVANILNFAVTFTVPYLLDAIGSKVGFVYGSISTVCLVLIFFFVPEMTGRSLEEIDEMFESRIPAWKSRSFVATGSGAVLTQLENHHKELAGEGKLDGIEHVEASKRV